MPEEEAAAIADRLNALLWWYVDRQSTPWEDYHIFANCQGIASELLAASGYHLMLVNRPGFYGYQAAKKGL